MEEKEIGCDMDGESCEALTSMQYDIVNKGLLPGANRTDVRRMAERHGSTTRTVRYHIGRIEPITALVAGLRSENKKLREEIAGERNRPPLPTSNEWVMADLRSRADPRFMAMHDEAVDLGEVVIRTRADEAADLELALATMGKITPLSYREVERIQMAVEGFVDAEKHKKIFESL